MIYAHVPTKDSIAGQHAYFLELLKVTPNGFGSVSADHVTTLRYMVAGNLFMRFSKTLADKQGRWTASYLADETQAQQVLTEMIEADTGTAATATSGSVFRVTELTVGLNEADLVAIKDRAKRGIDARWRAVHWTANHLGTPVILDAASVALEGGID